MSKFTPGPYEAFPIGDGSVYVETPTTKVIAKVFDEDNTKLFAAAPDLLDALYAALPFVNDDFGVYKKGYAAKIEKQIRAAIDKAEGGEL